MSETTEIRVKRLWMRSIRRGTKEMDIILSRYAEERLQHMTRHELDLYEALLNENDQDLYQWVTHQTQGPAHLQDLIDEIGRSDG